MESLLSNEWYCKHIKGKQECMIGYSDSGKDAGRLAAAWGLYEVQVISSQGCNTAFGSSLQAFATSAVLDRMLVAWHHGRCRLKLHCFQTQQKSASGICYSIKFTIMLLLLLLLLSFSYVCICDAGEAGSCGSEVQCEADSVSWTGRHRRARGWAHPPGHPEPAPRHHQGLPACHHPGAPPAHSHSYLLCSPFIIYPRILLDIPP